VAAQWKRPNPTLERAPEASGYESVSMGIPDQPVGTLLPRLILEGVL
jgi:hypothetical protein